MKLMRNVASLLTVLPLAAPLFAEAATEFKMPATSPAATVTQQVASTEITVTYSRPAVRGREIFGALVPYGEVWRTGANAATTVSFSTPVTVGGKKLAAGDYEMFTIPGTGEWTFIFQEAGKQWGAYRYDVANDAARFAVKPVKLTAPVESFTISIDDVKSAAATTNVAWELVRVSVPITIDVKETVVPALEAQLKTAEKKPYLQAAMFYYDNNIDINRAAELAALAVTENPNSFPTLYRQALILEKKGDREGAIASAKASIAAVPAESPELQAEYKRLNGQILARLGAN
jgi:hypothetical protein